jgi:Tol biopolymer transport system component
MLVEGVGRAWHVDDEHVVYVDPRGAVFAAELDRRAMSLGTPVPLFDGVQAGAASAQMVLDTDGTMIFRRGSASGQSDPEQVVWVDRTGRPTPVDEAWRGDFETLALSPDETLLAVTDESDQRSIWVKELPDGPLNRLTPNGANNRRPAWTPDGRNVVYQAGDTAFYFDVRRADASTDARRFLQLDSVQVHQVSLSRDGRYTVYRVNGVPNGDLRYREVQGGDTVHHDLLIRDGSNEIVPALSPDGSLLAYVSDVSGTPEVYLRPFPDVMSARVKVSDGGGYEPGWSRDGSELFFMDGDGVFTAAAVVTDPTLRIESRTSLFQKGAVYSVNASERRWDVASDGRFLMVSLGGGGDGTTAPDLTLVDNWFAELRQILERQ